MFIIGTVTVSNKVTVFVSKEILLLVCSRKRAPRNSFCVIDAMMVFISIALLAMTKGMIA